MEKLNYYNNEIENIIWNIINTDVLLFDDMSCLIKLVADTIYQYDKSIDKESLNKIVEFVLENKFLKCYLYDTKSPLNKILKKDKFVSKVRLDSHLDLVSHRNDYNSDTFTEKIYMNRWNRVKQIKLIPQHEQKSQGWLNQRKECLTATAIAVVLDEEPYTTPAKLFLDKCDRGEPFIENVNVHHGKKYEEIGSMYYAFRNNIKVEEYGLIQHNKYPFIGASPDGICHKDTYDETGVSKMVGRLLEIKFPKSRKILTEGDLDGDICPHYYYQQVQTQLYVTGLNECDFLQCKIEEYDTWDEFY